MFTWVQRTKRQVLVFKIPSFIYLHPTTTNITLVDVPNIPFFKLQLTSVAKITNRGVHVDLDGVHCFIRINEKLLAVGKLNAKLFHLVTFPSDTTILKTKEFFHVASIDTWNELVAHVSPDDKLCMLENVTFKGISISPKSVRTRFFMAASLENFITSNFLHLTHRVIPKFFTLFTLTLSVY